MTAPGGNPPARSSAAKRYGPLIGIVVVIAVVAAVAVIGGRKDSTDSATKTTGPAAGASAADVPITYEQAKKQGKEKSITWADNCDTTTGRIKMPTVYAPPCLPKFDGNNGGDIGMGVTKDAINIVVYVPPKNGDLTSLLASQLDDDEKTAATGYAYTKMLEDLYETYGRKINFIRFDATGAWNDPVAGQADAQTVVERYKPFASLGGPSLTPAYADELSRNGVLCIGCGLSLPDSFYQDHAPHIWGATPTPEQFLVNLGDYITKRLNKRPASFGGDEVKNKQRVFGVVHFEQDPPVFNSVEELTRKCGAQQGYEAKATETYTFDTGKMPERATTIIAKMKEAGVTSIIFLGDPIMPIYLTKAATAQNYFPEWIVTGTVLTDTTVLGRFYDQTQWAHAFGLSNLPARTQREQQEPWRLHEWYYGQPPVASNTSAIIYAPISQIMLGIHMAGPRLTPETFKAGMFNYPESGGGPTTPHISYGDHGYFKVISPDTCKPDQPRLDFLGTDDVTEIWWDPSAEGPDEQGKTDKKGMWRYVDGGKRYLPGTMPATDSTAFNPAGSVTIIDQVPPGDVAPSYPPQNKPLPEVPKQ